MSWGAYKTIEKMWPGGASQTSLLFDMGRPYGYSAFKIPTMASKTAFDMWVAFEQEDGTAGDYQQYSFHDDDTHSHTFTIANSASVNGRMHEIHGGFRFYRMVATDSAPTLAMSFAMYCSDQGHGG